MQDRVPDGAATGSSGTGELEILLAFGAEADDAAALTAYALHCRARLEFEAHYVEHHGRVPEGAALEAFLLGELTPSRLAAYRAEAGRILKQGRPAKALAKARWPFFGLWVDAPMAPSGTAEPLNWRGLLLRLFVLLLAVITTAILLRVLFVSK